MTSSRRTMKIRPQCFDCGKSFDVLVDPEDYLKWHNGELIQRVMPYLSDADRELLISRTCNRCFEKLFPKNRKPDWEGEDIAF